MVLYQLWDLLLWLWSGWVGGCSGSGLWDPDLFTLVSSPYALSPPPDPVTFNLFYRRPCILGLYINLGGGVEDLYRGGR